MKISLSKLFDITEIKDSAIIEGVKPLVAFVNQFSDQMIRALRNSLTLQDNIKGVKRRVDFTHAAEQIVEYSGGVPMGIIPLRVIDPEDSLASFNWKINSKGELSITPYFRLASSTKIAVDIYIFFE